MSEQFDQSSWVSPVVAPSIPESTVMPVWVAIRFFESKDVAVEKMVYCNHPQADAGVCCDVNGNPLSIVGWAREAMIDGEVRYEPITFARSQILLGWADHVENHPAPQWPVSMMDHHPYHEVFEWLSMFDLRNEVNLVAVRENVMPALDTELKIWRELAALEKESSLDGEFDEETMGHIRVIRSKIQLIKNALFEVFGEDEALSA